MAIFLMKQGYQVDMKMFRDHLDNLTAWYTGDGWYRDGLSFNFYCPWAFHLYASIWCKWWGYENEPKLAKLFERRYQTIINNYPSFFGKNGESALWGRSIAYRFAAASVLPAGYNYKNKKLIMRVILEEYVQVTFYTLLLKMGSLKIISLR